MKAEQSEEFWSGFQLDDQKQDDQIQEDQSENEIGVAVVAVSLCVLAAAYACYELTAKKHDKHKDPFRKWRKRMDSCFTTQQVNEVLHTADHDSKFREWLLGQINGNLECCSSRTKMGFNEIYTKWKLVTAVDLPRMEKKKLVKAAARTFALRSAIARRVNSLESVEVYLYYESKLKDTLGLLTVCTESVYSSIGKQLNVCALLDETLNTWERYLLEILDAHAELFPDYPTSVPGDRLADMQSQREDVDERFEAGKLSTAQYETQMKRLQTQFNDLLLACKRRWVTSHILSQ